MSFLGQERPRQAPMICYNSSGMRKRSRNNEGDVNALAKAIVAQATDTDMPKKNPAAVALGRLGGLKGGKARAKKLSAVRRSEIAMRAARARWAKTRA